MAQVNLTLSAAVAEPGHAAKNKVPCVAGVYHNWAGHPMHIKQNLVSDFALPAVGNWAKASLEPDILIVGAWLGRFAAVVGAGCTDQQLLVGALVPCDLSPFNWLNTVLSNLRTTQARAFHSLR